MTEVFYGSCAACELPTKTTRHTWTATLTTAAGRVPVAYELCSRCNRRFQKGAAQVRQIMNAAIFEFLEEMRRIRAQEVAQHD